jgi:phytoene dehydrogenase-like protein
MGKRSIIVIGAGIGGLSLACYARMDGHDVRVLEMGAGPGGVCTSWTRGGYIFDGCIHNLGGSSPKSPLHEMWRDLGVTPAIEMRPYPELVRVERLDGGEPLTVHSDLDQLRDHLRRLSPADWPAIKALIDDADRFTHFDLMGLAVQSRLERAAALASVPALLGWGGMTLERFAELFSDPFLRQALPTLIYDWPNTPVLMLMCFLGRSHVGDYGWPVGGSLAFARAIERRLLELGGEIRYHAPVASILVEDDCAVGVRLVDGSEERADVVVSNANGHATIFGMLGGRYTNPAIRRYYGAPEDRIEMGIHVSLGVARDLSGEPHAIVLPLAEPIEIAGETRSRLYVEPFGFDPSLAPPGKSPLKVMFATSYRYWEKLHRRCERYAMEKTRIAQTVIDALEPRFPGLRRQVEVVDVATPMTTLRHTGNGHGYRFPAARLARALFTGRRLSQTLPGLRGFYMVGQWAGVPGVPMTAAMGRDVAHAITREDDRRSRRASAALTTPP